MEHPKWLWGVLTCNHLPHIHLPRKGLEPATILDQEQKSNYILPTLILSLNVLSSGFNLTFIEHIYVPRTVLSALIITAQWIHSNSTG